MLTVVTTLPLMSVMLVPAGMCSSSPGMNGLVMTMALVVGDGIVTACKVSSNGIQMVNDKTVVRSGVRLTPVWKMP